MISTVRTLPFILAGVCLPSWAEPAATGAAREMRPSELRAAVAAHRAEQREEVQRQQAAAGKRLTAEELAQLRNQVRQQSHGPSTPAVDSRSADRESPARTATAIERAHLLPWSQRR